MNTAKVVRWEADEHGVKLRLWVDDENEQHLAVCEIVIEESVMIAWARAVAHEQNRSAQYMIRFDR